MNKHDSSGFVHLMKSRRFAPFFITQFLGAFNDNFYKQSIVLLISFGALSSGVAGLNANDLNNIAAAIFIIPFFLFSALAGQIADLTEKSKLIRNLKSLEIAVMAAAAIAFYFESVWWLLLMLFFMGAQSAFFGPVKYAIIPQHLSDQELTAGNALVEAGTFLAIILGYIAAAFVLKSEINSLIGVCAITFAVIGRLASQSIPEAPSDLSHEKLKWNFISQSVETLKIAQQDRRVWLSVLGVSWFWFLGASYITQLPEMVKTILNGTEDIYILLLCLFSAGVAIGSVGCEKLSGNRVEIGLVPFGALGLSIFGIDIYFGLQLFNKESLDLSKFLDSPGSFRIMTDFFMIGVFGGFYIVPLYAFIQQITHLSQRARVIAANNILNALYMVGSAITGIVLIGAFKLSIDQFFLVIAVLNIAAVVVIFSKIPDFSVRFLVWILGHSFYRVTHCNMENIPEKGPCVLICNHVSYVDAMLLMGAIRRPVRFVMFKPIFEWPILSFIFKAASAIPIHSKNTDPETYAKAFDLISDALQNDEVICIFPEGKITTDGEIDEFKGGVEKILARNPVPVIPLALRGLWGSFFSHKNGRAFRKFPHRFWSKVEIIVGQPLLPNANTNEMRSAVANLRGEHR